MHPRGVIERYLAEGLTRAEEATLRDHLRGCADCRRVYDDEVRLRRALAGAPTRPTRAEDARLERLVLQRAGLPLDRLAPVRATRRPLRERVRENPWLLGLPACAAAVVLIMGLWMLQRPRATSPKEMPHNDTPAEALIVARITQSREASLDGAPIEAGAAIKARGTLAVSARGLAEVTLSRGGQLRVFPQSRIRFAENGETVELEEGRVWCEVEPGHGRFMVRTDRGEARVLGTSFIVEKSTNGETDVRVQSGIVEVEDAAHRGKVHVKRGQRTRISSGSPPEPVRSYDAQSERDDLEREFKKLKRELERTIQKIGDKLRLR
jgi:hypothetical protein